MFGGPRRGHMTKKAAKAKDTKKTIKRIASYLGGRYLILAGILLSVLLSSAMGVIAPYFMGKAIDTYLSVKNLSGFFTMIALMFAVNAAGAFFSWLMTYLTVEVAQDAVKKIRTELFSKMQRLSLKFFDSHSDGDLTSRLTNDVDNISTTLNQSLTQLISSLVTIAGVVIMMLLLSWQLSMISFIMIPMIALLTREISKHTRKSFKEKMSGLGALNGHIEETISGQKVVKAYGQEQKVTDVFSERNKVYKDAAVRADILSSVMGPLMNMMNNTTYALIALIGGVMIVRGYTTVGIVVTFVNYSRQFSRPINQIASLYNTIQGAIAGAERVFEIIDHPPEIISEPGAEKPEHLEGQVSFEAVDFSYAPGSKVLKGVTFKAQAGESIALVGPTGAGKTTIINLLTRFYDIDLGHIKIDGRPIKAYDVQTLRSKIGIVLQDTYLFSDTVMENIRYGRLDATDEEVIEAAKLASAHQFIHRLPNGYETALSSEGTNISQGQRQLIAIARTILASPDILILDEATSSVDTRTEQHIQEGLLNLMQGRTSFVIAHRLSTIRRADQILVIRDGEVFERGSHDTLLSVDGFYSELYNAQFRKKVS